MKKLISIVICISMLLSMLPLVSHAVEVTTPVFVDFEDFVGGDSTKYNDDYIQFPSASKNYKAPVIDAEHGKSIEIITSGSMNLYSRLTKNAVFGFSYFSNDTNAGFAVSSKASNSSKNNDGWVDVDAFLKVDGSSIKLGSTVLQNNTYTKGTWMNFIFGVDYTNHEIDLYIDGKYITTYQTGKSGFKGTDRFLFGTIANRVSDSDDTKGASHYFDNMFVYYPPQSVTTTISGTPSDSSSSEEITVDFGQNVILPSGFYVTLNGTSVDAEPVTEYGYVTGLNISDLSLSGGTEYTVAFHGIVDFLGNTISDYVFTTDAVTPDIDIACKNPGAVYGVGDTAEFEIESEFLDGNNIEVYLNDELIDTLDSLATEFSVELVGGNNEIYVKVPALSLESEKVDIYVDDTPVIAIAKDGNDTVFEIGDSVSFTITSANLNGNSIEVYRGDVLLDTLSSDATSFTVELIGGNNEIYVKVPALSIQSESVSIYIDNTPAVSIAIEGSDAEYDVGDSVNFTISSANLNGNSIEVYRGDVLLETLPSDATGFSVELIGGNNEIYAKVPALSVESERVIIYVDDTPAIAIAKVGTDTEYEVGDIVSFTITSDNLYDNNIEVYRGDVLLETLPSDATEFSVELIGGNNEIYAKVPALSVESGKITIFIDNTPSVSIASQGVSASCKVGDRIRFTVENENLNGNSIEIYHNGSLVNVLDENASEFTIVLESGNNAVFAKVPAFDLVTETVIVLAKALGPVGDIKCFNFEDGSLTGIEAGSKEGTIEIKQTDAEHGKSLYFYLDGTVVDASVANNKPYLVVDKFTNQKGIYVYESDIKFSQVEEKGTIFPIKCKKGGSDVWNTLYVLENGDIKLNVGTKETIYSGVLADKWYNFKAIWNAETSTSEFYVNGVLVASDVQFSSKNIDSFSYVNMSIISKTGVKSSMYMDNIKSYFISTMANVEAVYGGDDSTEVPYENAVISLSFDMPMNSNSLKGVKLTSEDGKVVSVDFTSSDRLNFTATLSALTPNTSYTVDLSKVRSESGVGVSSESLNFKTQKTPFAIKDARATIVGNNVKVDVDIQNKNSEEKTYIVMAALYSGNMMLSFDAKSYTSSEAVTSQLTLSKPGVDYAIEVYVYDSLERLNLIDKLIIE